LQHIAQRTHNTPAKAQRVWRRAAHEIKALPLMADTAEFQARRDEMESTVYQGITDLIQKAYNEENPRGRNATSLAVHGAMARVMADVCTDRKVEVVCEIEQSFVENWALTHFLMKDKQDHFMRLW
jgi:hypothetical protein